jgi:hypothetical protein
MRTKEIPMKSIRNFAYAGLLAFTALNFAPSLASAQEEAHGTFTLTHDVRWQNAAVPAGEYRFSFNSEEFPRMLMLSKMSGDRTGFMLMVRDSEETKPSDASRLVLETSSAGSYVSAMELAEYGVTLHFSVPAPLTEKRIATTTTKAATTTIMASAR